MSEEKKITRKDYCGPFWMPSFMRKWASSKFNASCKIHDMDYDSERFTRKEADARFLFHMLKQAHGSVFWVLMAGWYYTWVRLGGWISWNKAKKDRSNK